MLFPGAWDAGILDGTGLGHPHSRAAPWSEAVPWGLEGGAPSQIPVFPPQCSPLPCLERGFGILCCRSQWLLQDLLAPFVEMLMLRKRSYEDPAHSLGTCLCVPRQGRTKTLFLAFCQLMAPSGHRPHFPTYTLKSSAREGSEQGEEEAICGSVSFISLEEIWWRCFYRVIVRQSRAKKPKSLYIHYHRKHCSVH